MKLNHRHLSWYVSVVFYRYSYIEIAHQLDEDLFAYLGDQLEGIVAVDCGCGPGIMTGKLLSHGAVQVFAIDHNSSMLRQLHNHLPEAISSGRVIPVQARFNATIFSSMLAHTPSNSGFDLILFKRSLYMSSREALPILQAAVAALNPRGKLVVIHGERSVYKYAFGSGGRIASYTIYHLINRFFSRAGHILGLGEYNLYPRDDLVELLRLAAPGKDVELIPSQQCSYNLIAVTK